MSVWRLALVGVAAATTACTGGGDSATATTTSSFFVADAPAVEPAARVVDSASATTVEVVLGAAVDEDLVVTQCTRGSLAAVDGGGETEVLLNLVARGATAEAVPTAITIRRFAQPGAALTITDTVTYSEGPDDAPVVVLQAQRFEVAGAATDPRDPGAVGSLVVDDGDQVIVDGVFGPPGAFAGDPGLVRGSVAARCSSD